MVNAILLDRFFVVRDNINFSRMARQSTRYSADVVIVGGGPATLGLLCNAARNNK